MSTITLSQEEIKSLSSDYISHGLKNEKWSIREMKITDKGAMLLLSMDQTAVSSTDDQGFHLSFLTAMEMLAQMMVIYLHQKAGLKTKCREIWVSRIDSKFIKPIRDSNHITIEMIQLKLHSRGSSLACDVDCKISDQFGGHFQSEGRVWLV